MNSYPSNHFKRLCASARRAQIGKAFDRKVTQELALLFKHIGSHGKCSNRSSGRVHCSRFSAILVKNPRKSHSWGMTFCKTPSFQWSCLHSV